MTTIELRRHIKKTIDQLPESQLKSLADYVAFLNRPSISDRLSAAEKDIRAGKGVSWRMVRKDV